MRWTVLKTGIPSAAANSGSFTTTEFDVPPSPVALGLLIVGFLLFLFMVIRLYVRDTQQFRFGWRFWLLVLRLGTIAVLAVIFLNPRSRTQHPSFRPSRVAVLVDTSSSMRFPANDPSSNRQTTPVTSRSESIRTLLAETGVLEELRKRHELSFWSFDAKLSGPHTIRETDPPDAASGDDDDELITWSGLVRPRGLETRLGECIQELVREIGGRTLSGVVVLTDGAANAGLDPMSAAPVALSSNTRLISIGVGSTRPPVNLLLSGLQVPTDVHIGDGWDLTAFVQGHGLDGERVDVSLLIRSDGDDDEPTLIETRSLTIPAAGIPVPVTFRQTPAVAGSFEYFIRVHPSRTVVELSDDDNQRRRTVNVVERRTRILLIAGGPMREYRFVRDMIYRHSAMNADVWLQTVDPSRVASVSQESTRLLTEFPQDAVGLAEYDVLIAFDVDWQSLSPEQSALLLDWVGRHAGGMILVAGDVHTPELAGADARRDAIRELYPVYLFPVIPDLEIGRGDAQPQPVTFTTDGRDAGFLALNEGPAASVDSWNAYRLFRCYPTAGSKSGATVLALMSDMRKRTEHGLPILLATQFFGAGKTLYIGTTEIWRMRAVSAEYYARFWTRVIREVGQGRLNRTSRRGVLLLERNQYALGQTVRVRAQLYDSQLNPLEAAGVSMVVNGPHNQSQNSQTTMLPDGNHPGQYVGTFHAGHEGTWNVTVEIPDSDEELTGKIEAVLPNLESDNPRQNAGLLAELARETGGSYLTIDQAPAALPELLPDRSEQIMVEKQPKTLWDRKWVLYLLTGLLSAEWLTRKLLKLA